MLFELPHATVQGVGVPRLGRSALDRRSAVWAGRRCRLFELPTCCSVSPMQSDVTGSPRGNLGDCWGAVCAW